MYALSVGTSPVPYVVTDVDRCLAPKRVVLGRGSSAEQGVVLGEVKRRKDIGDAIVDPCPVSVHVAFPWRPRRRYGEKACSDAREVPGTWVLVRFRPARPGRRTRWSSGAEATAEQVARYSSGAEATTVRAAGGNRHASSGLGAGWGP